MPIRYVWASSIFLLAGGGSYAAEMILGIMVAKSCTENTRYVLLPLLYVLLMTELELAASTIITHVSL